MTDTTPASDPDAADASPAERAEAHAAETPVPTVDGSRRGPSATEHRATGDAATEDGATDEGGGHDDVGSTLLGGDLTESLSHDTQSGWADYEATNTGGVSAGRGVPLPEDEQGRGTAYDPVDQGPQQEG